MAHPPQSSVTERGKRPRTAVAGPYGHPIHPILVTVPIGAWVSSLVFDIVAKASDDPSTYATGSAWLIGIGAVGAVAAAVFGGIDLSGIPRGTRAFTTGVTHMVLNIAVLLAYLANLALRRADGLDDVGTFPLVLSVVSLGVLGASGWLGGKLAYRYGIRVADEQTQEAGFGSTR